jgi:hypothetical protein
MPEKMKSKHKDVSLTIAVVLIVAMSIVAIAVTFMMAVPISDIFRNPDNYMGKEVTLTGLVINGSPFGLPSTQYLLGTNDAMYFLINNLQIDLSRYDAYQCNVKGIVTTDYGQIAIRVTYVENITNSKSNYF